MIHCCGKNQRSKAFICDPPEGYIYQRIDFLVWCKVCKHTVMQVTRVNAKIKPVTGEKNEDFL